MTAVAQKHAATRYKKNPFLIGVNSKRFAFPQMELIPSYLRYKPDAHLILGCHADLRGSEEYNLNNALGLASVGL